MNASETLLREILREMQKQTEILERIDRNLPQTDDLDSSEAERRKSFRKDLEQLRETLQKQKQKFRIESIILSPDRHPAQPYFCVFQQVCLQREFRHH